MKINSYRNLIVLQKSVALVTDIYTLTKSFPQEEKFGIVLDSNASDATVMKYLKQGYPCVVAGKNYSGYNYKGEKLSGKYSGGHFVCLTGIDSQGRVRVNDSGNNPSNGKAITAFFEGKTPAQSRTTSQTAILYPANMSALV